MRDESDIFEVIRTKKGLNIPISGKAEKTFGECRLPDLFAIKPTDFHGLTPKMAVKESDPVKAGTTLFFDKIHPEIKFVSPVSGTVKLINRGERRRLLEVIVESDGKDDCETIEIPDASALDREKTINILLESGAWTYLKQRPYDIIANPDDMPKAIFVSGFDTSPLAPDVDFVLTGMDRALHAGIGALMKLCPVHVALQHGAPAKICTNHMHVNHHYFAGQHPAGNVGVQIHHILPIAKGEKVWTVTPQEVVSIGNLFLTGKLDFSRIMVIAGPSVEKPMYVRYKLGASISELVKNNVKEGHIRYISGNILTGQQIEPNGFVGFHDTLVTVIPEGDKQEFFGWATPGFGKFSTSRSFFSPLCKKRQYPLNANMHGGQRAIVVSGEYDKVMPMDILTEYLIKAILAEDIDKMEQLGIYEVVEEDIALCEFVCSSKLQLQSILRKGFELMIKEIG
ncbi:MAG: Na(+)-translocating NADH-quinone reductase subunit A [Cytophagaceae bacterium]|jgi:Na+-transporting NADH:ubiquinone oxidoreductase subunit A|nr:Na(+)-translocating NADH-quinone reductase subunit A [Cytophagaceae bacterium]